MNLILAMMAISSVVFLTANVNGEISLESLCIFSSKDHACFIDKSKDIKKTDTEIDKYYCMNETDLRKITSKLQEKSK
jgi:hypothetical protein